MEDPIRCTYKITCNHISIYARRTSENITAT